MGSGLIYLAIVVVWAAILIPMFLRSRDAAMEDRSVERFDHAMSILSQQEEAELPQAVEYQAARSAPIPQIERPAAVVAERRPARPDSAQSGPAQTGPGQSGPPQSGLGQRTSNVRSSRRKSLARRRARTLSVLLGLTLVTALLAATPVLPLWAPVPLVVLLVAFVVHLRNQAVRTQRLSQLRRHGPRVAAAAPATATPDAQSSNTAAASRETGAPVEGAAPPVRPASGAEFVPGPSRAVVVETKGSGDHAPAAAATSDDDEEWRPNPLPLPTYVTAPKAVRSIRVIDLTTPGAWSSGRLLDDDAALEDVLAEQVAADELDALLEHEATERGSGDESSRRAVGD